MIDRVPNSRLSTDDPFSYEFEEGSPAEGTTTLVDDAWPQPTSLPSKELPLPPFDPDLIPAALRPWILDAAERIGVPPESILMAALTGAATVIGNTPRIQPKNRDDQWTQAPNVFSAVIGASSSGKSPALSEGFRFLHVLQKGRSEAHAKEAKQRKARAKLADVKLKDIQTALRSTEDDAKKASLESQMVEAMSEQEQAKASGRRYVLNDATVEKAGMLLGEPINRGGVLLFRDELSGILDSMGRAGHENDRTFYLEGYNGTGSYYTDKVTREAVDISVLTLSLIGGMQPVVLDPLVAAARSGKGDDGLLPRFQLTVWIDSSSARVGLNRAPDRSALESAEAAFRNLEAATLEREASLAPGAYESVAFTDEAQEIIDRWWASRVHASANGHLADENPGYASHLGKGLGMVSRVALLYYAIDQASGVSQNVVTADQASLAVRLMEFLHGHARRTYQIHIHKGDEPLQTLWTLIDSGEVWDGMTTREFQRGPSGFGKRDKILPLLRRAEDLGWLRLKKIRARGKPSSTVIEVNPLLR
ncbi:MAG: DUF3987 domain-containing protein [Trueperaceae bacterium]